MYTRRREGDMRARVAGQREGGEAEDGEVIVVVEARVSW